MSCSKIVTKYQSKRQKKIDDFIKGINYENKAYERFLKYIQIDPCGCWVFGGGSPRTDTNGYKSLWNKRRTIKVYRYSYETYTGPVPEGLQIDHLCRHTNCCNPEHLEAVTRAENMRRSTAPTLARERLKSLPTEERALWDEENCRRRAKAHAARTHCKHGHLLTPDNTIIMKIPHSGNYRRGKYYKSKACRKCREAIYERYELKRKQRKQ